MSPNKSLVVCLLLPLILASDAEHPDIEDISKTLDKLLVGDRSYRRPRDREDTDLSLIWQKYEFGSGAGNREEVVVTGVSSHRYTGVPESNGDWQFLRDAAQNAYLIRAEDSTLFLHRVNLDDSSVERSASVTTEGRILLFKVLEPNVEGRTKREERDFTAVLFVESERGYFLCWYRISGDTSRLYARLSVQHEFRDMEIVRGGNQSELLLLNDNVAYPGHQSSIDVYGFSSDYSNRRIDIWFCRRLYVPKTSDVQVCPIYGGTVLALRANDSVVLYESPSEDARCQYEESTVIESHGLANFVCFESGYIKYLAIVGRQTRLFHLFENEFQDSAESDLLRDGANGATWVTAVPLDTYRDESLLLVQFDNSTVIALAWQGSSFKEVPLPNQIMNDFDLSRAVVVPKVGFLHGNTLVRLDVSLKELAHRVRDETASMLEIQDSLEDVFRKQETTLDQTESQLNQSYLRNPVTGFWNLSRVDATDVAIGENVIYGAIKVGKMDLQLEDVMASVTSSLEKLEELEARLERVLSNSEDAADVFTMKIVLPPDVELNGDFLVNGTLRANNVTAAFVNNASTSAADDDADHLVGFINGQKSFPSVDADDLTVVTLNGIPLEEYVFDASIRSYDDVDFSSSKRLEIGGHLNFSEINDVDWRKLMRNIVWKNESRNIPGDTIVNGHVIVDDGIVGYLNGLQYPKDYVPSRGWMTINVTGEKRFTNLSARHFVNVSTINDIDIDDFIVLSRHELLDREITFENLWIDGILQIDGNTTGINATNFENSLNETDTIKTDVVFENLFVAGDIVLRGAIDAKTWSDLDDLLLKTEGNARITGNKRFTSGVTLRSTVNCSRINGHKLSEFVNLDADQEFPHLERISASVTFGNVNLGAVNQLKDYIIREQSVPSGCMSKMLFFEKTPVVDDIFFETVKHNIARETFFARLNETFREAHFENLVLSTLTADEIVPGTINGIWNYSDLTERALTVSTRQNLTGFLTVNSLEVGVLNAGLVNGEPMRDFNRSLTRAKSLHDDVFDAGNATLRSLRVTGVLMSSSINGRDIFNGHDERNTKSVIFQKNVTIERLTVLGLVNGRNLSEFVDDAVWKSDRNVTFTGAKTFANVTCEFLDARLMNGHFVDDILDPDREQVLRGPVVVNGSVTVLGSFNTTGRIGNVFLSDFADRFRPLGNNSYALRGDVRFTEDVSVARLDASGPIQGSVFDDFLQRAVVKNDSNVAISGEKLFRNKITFNDRFTILDKLDDLDLRGFREKAVYVDRPFTIGSRVTFNADVHVRKRLLVRRKLRASTVSGVDMKDLQENVVFLNSPTNFLERMTLDNVTFQESVKVAQVNDLRMDELIPLHTDEPIVVDILKCASVTYKNVELRSRVNSQILDNIYADTLTIHDDQKVTGTIKIQGNVYAYSDFNVHFINNFKPSQIISVNDNDTLTGNFVFEDLVILNNSLRILGLLNGIDPINWQGTAVMKTGQAKQIVLGKWRIHGNVTFEKNVNGTEFLNGVNITETSVALTKERVELNPVVEEKNENLSHVCETLNALKCASANQIYKFNTFDYLKIFEFDGDIHDMYNIDSGDLGYLLVNHGDCNITLLQYTSTSFTMVDEVSDVGLIDRWIPYKSNRTMYVLTVAKRACGRSLNNMWKLEDNQLTHMLELGNASDFMYQDALVGMTRDDPATVSESDLQSNILKALASYEEERSNSILYNDSIAPVNQTFIHELRSRSTVGTPLTNCLNCHSLLSFRVGVHEREEHVYYNEEISQNHIYIWKNDAAQTRILQIIKAHRPKSFLILNFEGFVETLLIFVENNEAIRIYEYRGIEGFVYRNSIKMRVDQLYKFKMRKYTHMEKRHLLAAVSGDRLTILEAKMHGERLDLATLTSTDSCSMNACPTR